MNPKFRNYSDQELAREIEAWADKISTSGNTGAPVSVELLRVISDRLMTARHDAESRVDEVIQEEKAAFMQNIKRQLGQLSSEVFGISERLQDFAEAFRDFQNSEDIGTDADPLNPD